MSADTRPAPWKDAAVPVAPFWWDGKTRTTTDTYTGKRFRWNDVVFVGSVRTPAKSAHGCGVVTWLDPTRVPAKLLRELNPELLALLGVA